MFEVKYVHSILISANCQGIFQRFELKYLQGGLSSNLGTEHFIAMETI